MKKKVVIDFESYYDKEISVKIQGNENYARLKPGYIVAATVGTEVWGGTIAEMADVVTNICNDTSLEPWAANSNFDQRLATEHYDITKLPNFSNWKCLLDLAAFHQMPRNLAGFSKSAQGVEMSKGVRDAMCGVKYENLPDSACAGSELLTKQKVLEYCCEDVRRSQELLEFVPPMSPIEDRIAEHTRMINRRGVHIDTALVDHDKTLLHQMRHEAFLALPWHTDSKPLSYDALKDWCVYHGYPVPQSLDKKDEECIEIMSECEPVKVVIESMRRYRKANTLLEKLETLYARMTPDGILPLDMLYCGAPHTRRWSSKFFNIQNLDKKPTKVTNDGKTIWSRNWVLPPPGKMFLILDFAQVEPRFLNWIAGNKPMMEALKKGFSYYESYAAFARNWRGAPGSLKTEYGVEKYTLLKNESIGLGYGMGVDRFIGYAAENGLVVTPAQAKPIVDGFRANNPLITGFWKKLDSHIMSAARDKEKTLALEMPTGDYLKYFSVRIKRGGGYEGYTVKGVYSGNNKQSKLWGGTLTENVCQRLSRDALAEAVLRLEDAGVPVAFHTHDEAILVVDKTEDPKKREEIKEECIRIMVQNPEWCKDLPLGVDGDFSMCYTKF